MVVSILSSSPGAHAAHSPQRDDKMFLGPLAGSMSPQSGETSAMTYSTLPEVTTGPPMDYYGRDKLDAAEAKAEGSIPVATENSPTICGLKKKTFFIILAVAIIVIAGAIAGGVAGGLTANNSSNSDSDADTDSSGDTHDSNDDNENSATKTTVGSPGPTGPTAPEDRAMAASTSSDFNVQLFYQDLNTTDILYRRIQDDKAADEKTLDLDIEPQWGSSIAATVLNGSDHISARVFYVTIDEGSRQVAQATLECEADGETCSTKSNSIISANMTGDIHPNTKLSALYLRDDFVRVFYQAGGGHIWVLTNDGDDDKWGQTHMVSRAYPGSGIVAAAPNDDDIHLFFVSGESERLRFMVYSDILGADDGRLHSVCTRPHS